VQDKLLASAGWASRKILEQSQSYRENNEATQDPVNISPAFAKRVKMARKYAPPPSTRGGRHTPIRWQQRRSSFRELAALF